jgi:dipeptidyl-peptidase-4
MDYLCRLTQSALLMSAILRRGTLALFIAFVASVAVFAQPTITIDDIWTKGTFRTRGVPGFNFMLDGRHYTTLEGNNILRYDLTTGKLVDTLLDIGALGLPEESRQADDYSFSSDEAYILLTSGTESVYRHSTREWTYIYNRTSGRVFPLSKEGKQMHATFSPDGSRVAYVRDNDLYLYTVATGTTTRVTDDGKWNHLINGSCDWVYEEEFSFTKAFAWSPDSRHLAYYRFDESRVPEFTMTNYTGELYPEYETFKYPKVGMPNSLVSVHIYDTQTQAKAKVDRDSEPDGYIPRIKWTEKPGKLCVFWMNRHQNQLDLLLADATSGRTSVMLHEDSPYYIDITDDLTFLSGQDAFLWTSEQSGYRHIYLYGMDGKLKQALTSGNWEVTGFYGIDEKNGTVYYQAATRSPMEREICSVDLKGKNRRFLADKPGTNSAQFSTTYDLYVLNHATANTPPTYGVYDRAGKLVRELETNEQARKRQSEYGVQPVEFFSFTTSEDVLLNGYMIKPYNFDPTRKYPVLMTVYGGPGSQEVVDNWFGNDYWWFQSLAQQGYVVACVDNRGTGGRGESFKKMTYLQLGHYETLDQIEAARYLGQQTYIDPARIGIFGWSYGGYMSSLCILKGADVFNAAIAVAPVTNWKWYDSIYTERYMRTHEENEKGYEENSPVNFADRLTGNYLLVHGSSDDNVHYQHSMEMAAALIKANKQYETYIYPNRNHAIYGDNARRHLFVKMTDFLNRALTPDHPLHFTNQPPKS